MAAVLAPPQQPPPPRAQWRARVTVRAGAAACHEASSDDCVAEDTGAEGVRVRIAVAPQQGDVAGRALRAFLAGRETMTVFVERLREVVASFVLDVAQCETSRMRTYAGEVMVFVVARASGVAACVCVIERAGEPPALSTVTFSMDRGAHTQLLQRQRAQDFS